MAWQDFRVSLVGVWNGSGIDLQFSGSDFSNFRVSNLVKIIGNRWFQLSQTQLRKITTRKTIDNTHGSSLLKYTEGGDRQNSPTFISCRYLVGLGPRQLGLPVSEINHSADFQ